MRITTQISSLKRIDTDAVVIIIHEDQPAYSKAVKDLRTYFGKMADSAIELNKFTGKEKQILSFYSEKRIRAPRVILVGIGPTSTCTLERYRRAAAAAIKLAQSLFIRTLAFSSPINADEHQQFSDFERAYALTEGSILALYKYEKYITKKETPASHITQVILLMPDKEKEKEIKKGVREATAICSATCFARDLENAPPNEIYPETLAERAKESAKLYGYGITVWDKKQIERAGFGGLMAVNSGSNRPARFIKMEYNGNRTDGRTVVLVGKGVTFDAGGISIKPASGMSEMKMDMSGAAAVIGTMQAASVLKLPVRLVGLVPATENLLGGSAMRPGDIIKHYGGLTSEVDNTDAEGRLILADALAYASTLKPDLVIDLATLTGACVVALGQHATGMMGNDVETMASLKKAGERTYERVWELPLFEEYEKQIKSDVADVKNVGGRWAGAITAALFLKKFVGDYKWVHLDIAGTAILEEPLPYSPKGGSGVGVRLLVEFLKSF